MKPILDRVTITGADDSIKPEALTELSRDFPFVEWGILASENNTVKAGGQTRYPSPKWISDLQAMQEYGAGLNLSLHINGRWVRELLMGRHTMHADLWTGFQRCQLNFHAERNECDAPAFAGALKVHGQQFIFQLDGQRGNAHFTAAILHGAGDQCFGLFDVSGGAGILPDDWPTPTRWVSRPGNGGIWAYQGYAGGLGPENLAEQIPLILEAASEAEGIQPGRIWIDMETRVRSENDRQFDLAKVRRCLEIAAPFVSLPVADPT
jgi:hypothetical protein